jgi:hypothetical protein
MNYFSKENVYIFRTGETLRLRPVHVAVRRKRRAVHTNRWVKQDKKPEGSSPLHFKYFSSLVNFGYYSNLDSIQLHRTQVNGRNPNIRHSQKYVRSKLEKENSTHEVSTGNIAPSL